MTLTPRPTVYECSYCERKYFALGEFEYHCYNNGHDHRDVNLERIKKDAAEEITEANRIFEQEIFQAGKAANEAAERAVLQNQRAAQQKAKKDLPFVK